MRTRAMATARENGDVLSAAAAPRVTLWGQSRQHRERVIQPRARPGRDRHVNVHRGAEATG